MGNYWLDLDNQKTKEEISNFLKTEILGKAWEYGGGFVERIEAFMIRSGHSDFYCVQQYILHKITHFRFGNELHVELEPDVVSNHIQYFKIVRCVIAMEDLLFIDVSI